MLRTTTTTKIAAGAAIVALAAAGCGSKSTPAASAPATTTSAAPATTASAAAANFSACMVTDTGGIDDKSFNASAWKGMQDAQSAGKAQVQYVQSTTENDYVPNINNLLAKGCSLIVTVGGLMGDATTTAANANPSKKFAIVDSGATDSKGNVISNLHGMEFNTAQGAFLAGYAAAGTSKTGTVATWGGLNIPPVTVYMDGFWEGVQYYNKQKGKNVKVLGWDETNQKGGTFSQSFTDTAKGKQITDAFVNQGADVIFPVAGGSGLGAGAAADASGGKAKVIWVDTDGCQSAAQYCKDFLSSVTKGLASAVQTYLKQAATGTYPTGSYIGTLANGGTGLAPYDSSVPQALQTEIAGVKADIVSGKIKITSPSQPAS